MYFVLMDGEKDKTIIEPGAGRVVNSAYESNRDSGYIYEVNIRMALYERIYT